jgi:hypothetical protein
MVQTDVQGATSSGAGVWIFRVLLIAGAAFMVYSWYTPWWGASIAVLPGDDHMLMRPWGIEVHGQVRANADPELWAMPAIFEPFMWTYFAVCMLALALSLFISRRLSLGRFKLPVATLLILLVGLSYILAVVLAYVIGEWRAGMADSAFVGEATVTHAMTGNKVKMEGYLKMGYYYALAAGAVLVVIALLRGLFVRSPKT